MEVQTTCLFVVHLRSTKYPKIRTTTKNIYIVDWRCGAAWRLWLWLIWFQVALFHSPSVELNMGTEFGPTSVQQTTRSVQGNTLVVSTPTPWFTIQSPWSCLLMLLEKWAFNYYLHKKNILCWYRVWRTWGSTAILDHRSGEFKGQHLLSRKTYA